VNFARDVVGKLPGYELGLVSISAEGERREWTFGEIGDRSARVGGTLLSAGIGRGDVVATFAGNRPEWVFAMVACWRIGAAVLPCNEQLRPNELAKRLEIAHARAVFCDERNLDTVEASGFDGLVFVVPDNSLYQGPPAPAVDLAADELALVAFTSGTSGEPKIVRHGQRYLAGQRVQAEHWYGARGGDLCWCTAPSGWSLSTRNAFVAPWLRGAAALVHDSRFDPEERLEVAARERVQVLCMAPTEYRAIAARTELPRLPVLRHAVAAGESLNAEIVGAWRDQVGIEIRDGYGQTETGALTGMPIGRPVRPGSMGRPLPGYRVWVEDGELCVDPATVATMMLGVSPDTWRTGDRVHGDDDGYLWFEGRTDDLIISSGYRIGPSEVESALASHPAVHEAVAVAAPDEIRGAVVRAVVVVRPGFEAGEALAADLQAHVKTVTAPYKYPRLVDFVDALPKTASGKIKRADLRAFAS